jgi:hypothetical protein
VALIQAEVDIANQSLAKIGANRFTLATAAGEEGVVSTLLFAQTRDSLTRSYWWAFPSTRLRLVSAWLTATVYTTDQYVWEDSVPYKCAEAHTSDDFATDLAAVKWVDVSATVKTDFGNKYDVPETMLRLLEFLYLDDVIKSVRGKRTWRLEGNTILTDEEAVDILYIDQQIDTTEWDSLFTELFILQLAINLTGPLTGVGSGGLKLKELLLKEMQILKKQVRTIARQEGRGDDRRLSYNESRLTNGGRIDSRLGS